MEQMTSTNTSGHSKKITEAIILAGGLGTRLRSAVPDLPKCMAPVKNKPFITYVIEYLMQQGVNRFIFSLGYQSDKLVSYLDTYLESLHGSSIKPEFVYCIEQEPLGTGGAIVLSCKQAISENVFVTNGDSLYKITAGSLAFQHLQNHAECTLSLKPMRHFDRYGVVELDENGLVNSFKEKQYIESGNINGGLYALNIKGFLARVKDEKFSFEKDYMEKYYTQGILRGYVQDAYFIDIGIPEDYNRAQIEL